MSAHAYAMSHAHVVRDSSLDENASENMQDR